MRGEYRTYDLIFIKHNKLGAGFQAVKSGKKDYISAACGNAEEIEWKIRQSKRKVVSSRELIAIF